MKAFDSFFLRPASAKPLAMLRMGLCLILIVQAWMLRYSILDFLAFDGLIQGDLAEVLFPTPMPRIKWLCDYMSPLGWSEKSCIDSVCWLYALSLLWMGIGFLTRFTTFLAWFCHWTLMNTGYSTSYGVDLYAHVFLFYLIWMPSGDAFSIDQWLSGRKAAPSASARLAIRVLQLHLCISYFCSGLEKARGIQWWNGELLWRALSLPVYRHFDMSWLAYWPFLSKLGGWAALALELSYCAMIWPQRTRKLWVLGITALHLGIAVFLGLSLFGTIMCILTLTVFGISAEPGSRLTPPLPCVN